MARVHASLDFETASSAGILWDPTGGARGDGALIGPPGAGKGKRGLSIVGVVAYAQHPSTRILMMAWALPGGPENIWYPWHGLEPLRPLFDWIAGGGIIGAHKADFEWWIWHEIAVPQHGFPPLNPLRLTCSMATAHVNGFPGKLALLGPALGLDTLKDKEGSRLIQKFSVPNKPTKKRPGFWVTAADDPEDFERFGSYCKRDVAVEVAACAVMPPMTQPEWEFWLEDQDINRRGLGINAKGVKDCISILTQVLDKRGREFEIITGVAFTQLPKFKAWLAGRGVFVDSLDQEHVEEILEQKNLDPVAREALEIRALIGSASVKKIFAMDNMASRDGRLHNLIIHHGARTGRPTGEGPQPLNLPRNGAQLATCGTCAHPFHLKHAVCPWCGVLRPPPEVERKRRISPSWKPEMADAVLDVFATRNLAAVEHYFGDAVPVIMGLVRALFEAGPGHHLLASDYSAIEAVVTGFLAGEEWRMDVFRQDKSIYLMSAAKITHKTLEFYEKWLAIHGTHHPDRQYIGKVAELALGFGGWIGAWRNFDKSDRYTDQEIKNLILAWRATSPKVVEMWGGQTRRNPEAHWDMRPELYGFEGAAIAAIQQPGRVFTVSGIQFFLRPAGSPFRDGDGTNGTTHADALIIRLLSGRELTYWEPLLSPSDREWAPPWELGLSYMTFNTNSKYGAKGWVRMKTYGARLTENIVQATAHCILRYAILNLKAAGFPTVLHVYDEIVVEVPAWAPPGALAEMERIMATMPPWCAHWPVRATGGWRGVRYRKDG